MEILARREAWIHTHFVTDCARLSTAQGREIAAALWPILRQHHLVYGIHCAESRHDPGLHIVLECIPLRHVLEQIEAALRHIIAPIPAQPTPARVSLAKPAVATPKATRPATASSASETCSERVMYFEVSAQSIVST